MSAKLDKEQIGWTHHLNNGTPVLGNLGKVERLRKVNQVENVLLETRTTETLQQNALVTFTDPD